MQNKVMVFTYKALKTELHCFPAYELNLTLLYKHKIFLIVVIFIINIIILPSAHQRPPYSRYCLQDFPIRGVESTFPFYRPSRDERKSKVMTKGTKVMMMAIKTCLPLLIFCQLWIQKLVRGKNHSSNVPLCQF